MDKLNKVLMGLEDSVNGFLLLSATVVLFINVIMRYVFHAPLFWVDEISTYLLLWGILLGWSLAQQDGRHVCVDLLYAFLPKKWQYRIGVFEKICSILFCIFLFVASVTLWLHYVNNAQVSTNAQIKLWIVYLIMPLSSLMFLIRFIEEIISLIRGGIDSLKSIDIGGGH